MTKDFEELFACLRHRNVRALVVGGYAVAFHGQPRFTNRVDLLTTIDDVTFDDAWHGRVSGHYGSEVVDYIGRVELIRNKRASGRPQDLLDVEGLE